MQSLESVFDFLHQFMTLHQTTKEIRHDIDVVVEELFANIVNHAGRGTDEVVITLDTVGRELSITLENSSAILFDLAGVPEPNLDLPLRDRKPGGLGVFLVKKLTDSVRQEFRDGKNIITVTKQLG